MKPELKYRDLEQSNHTNSRVSWLKNCKQVAAIICHHDLATQRSATARRPASLATTFRPCPRRWFINDFHIKRQNCRRRNRRQKRHVVDVTSSSSLNWRITHQSIWLKHDLFWSRPWLSCVTCRSRWAWAEQSGRRWGIWRDWNETTFKPLPEKERGRRRGWWSWAYSDRDLLCLLFLLQDFRSLRRTCLLLRSLGGYAWKKHLWHDATRNIAVCKES